MRGRPARRRAAVAAAFAAAVAVPALIVSAVSCGNSAPAPSRGEPMISLAPSVIVPLGISGITNYRLQVYPGSLNDSGVSCSSAGGISGALLPPLFQVSDSTGAGCGGGDARCFTNVELAQSIQPRIFYVTGYSKVPQVPQNLIAQGCASTTLVPGDANSTLSLSIMLKPVGATCGDGLLTVPETCDEPADGGAFGGGAACSSSCQTPEELLSVGSGSSGSLTLTGKPGDKSNPSFVWPLGGTFFGLFGDLSSGTSQVSLTALSATLGPTSAFGPVVEADSIYLPSTPGAALPPSPSPTAVSQPAAVEVDGIVYVAFTAQAAADAGGATSIELRSFNSGTLAALEASPCTVSDSSSGESGNLSAPAIAVTEVPLDGGTSAPLLYVAWQDESGRIYGRTYAPGAGGACGGLGSQSLLSASGTTNSQVALAGIPNDWIAVWKSGSSIAVRPIGLSGSPGLLSPLAAQGAGHIAASPSVTAIASGLNIDADNVGDFAIVWSDTAPGANATIYAQRYFSSGLSIEGEPVQISDPSLEQGTGGEITPVIAPSLAFTGSYVVTWVDAPLGNGSSTQVRARMFQAGGLAPPEGAPASAYPPTLSSSAAYLHNPIDGTVNEFAVGALPDRVRVSPTVAAGGGVGSTAFMAFGWVDNTTSGAAGVIARRFPLPTD